MKVLIIKTSSMGDVIHTLPALTDARKHFPNITFDWVVEESFAEIPRWHPAVNKVIPIAWRRWRKKIFSRQHYSEWRKFKRELQTEQYDVIIDAQGLIKSAFFSFLARGGRHGFDRASAREGFASLFYQHHHAVRKDQHAINRLRELFSLVLNYPKPATSPNYGIDRTKLLDATRQDVAPYVVFLHGTTWATKHWPESYWQELGKMVVQQGYQVKLTWGTPTEEARAQLIAGACGNAEVLPRMKLADIAKMLAGAKAIVAVDTGLGHLAAALNVPTVSLYGPTNPLLTGALGDSQHHLTVQFPCAPCFSKICLYQDTAAVSPACFTTLNPTVVWTQLIKFL